jgi:hypothetical protein
MVNALTVFIFTLLGLALIIGGFSAIIKGKIIFLKHEFTGLSARIVGGVLILLGLWPASIAIGYIGYLINNR